MTAEVPEGPTIEVQQNPDQDMVGSLRSAMREIRGNIGMILVGALGTEKGKALSARVETPGIGKPVYFAVLAEGTKKRVSVGKTIPKGVDEMALSNLDVSELAQKNCCLVIGVLTEGGNTEIGRVVLGAFDAKGNRQPEAVAAE